MSKRSGGEFVSIDGQTATIGGVAGDDALNAILEQIRVSQDITNVNIENLCLCEESHFMQLGSAISEVPDLQKLTMKGVYDLSEDGGFGMFFSAFLMSRNINLKISYDLKVPGNSDTFKTIDQKISEMIGRGVLSGLTLKLDTVLYQGQCNNTIKACANSRQAGNLKFTPTFELGEMFSETKEQLLGLCPDQRATIMQWLRLEGGEVSILADDGAAGLEFIEI